MSTQTIHLIIAIGLAIAIGSAMPDREGYNFPRQIGLYVFDWFYHTVKIITFNLAREAEKKGFKFQEPTSSITTQETKTVAISEPKA